MTLQVGQELWFVPSGGHHGPTGAVHIKKIGRRWAEISNWHRIDIKTMWADGGAYTSPGRCYLSRDDHEAEQRLQELWKSLQSRLREHAVPPGITEHTIRQVAALLNMPIDRVQS